MSNKNQNNFVVSLDKRHAIEVEKQTCNASLNFLVNAKQVFSAEKVVAFCIAANIDQNFAMRASNRKFNVDLKSINRMSIFLQIAAKAALFKHNNNDYVTFATIVALTDAKLTVTRNAIKAAITTKAESKRYKLDAATAAKIKHRDSINDEKTCERQASLLITAFKLMNIIKETSSNVYELQEHAFTKALRDVIAAK